MVNLKSFDTPVKLSDLTLKRLYPRLENDFT